MTPFYRYRSLVVGLLVTLPFVLSLSTLPNVKAAVIVPGFLTGGRDFQELADNLKNRGIPSVVVPMPVWHWLPCIGGRGMRPILERIEHTVKHVCSCLEPDGSGEIVIPPFQYSIVECLQDFMDNPGGVYEVGGSAEVDEYPIVHPRGTFVPPTKEPRVRIALIGHSAGGWISRIFLSSRIYGGKAYNGTELVHSLVTLGSPHAEAPGPAFRGVEWCNREPLPVRGLAIGATGTPGDRSGDLTRGAYAFCDPTSDGTDLDGDGLTTTASSLAMEGELVEKMVIDGVTHFPWTGAGLWGDFFAPDLTRAHRAGKLWYGDDPILDQWVSFLEKI